jgi:hypothetical protein
MSGLYSHPKDATARVSGRPLLSREKTQQGDVYSSSSGKWEPVPHIGVPIPEGNRLIYIRPAENEEPLARVTSLVMSILEGFSTQETVAELRGLSWDHHATCDLGSVPACTCGCVEARNFLKLFDSTLRGKQLIR